MDNKHRNKILLLNLALIEFLAVLSEKTIMNSRKAAVCHGISRLISPCVRYICLAIVLISSAAASEDFFRLPKESGQSFPKDQIYPRGRIIPIIPYSCGPQEKMKETGFTVIGPAYSNDTDAWASKYGTLPLVYTVHVKQGGKPYNPKKTNSQEPDEAEIRSDVEKTIKQAAKRFPNIAFWYISPEELRYWMKKEYRYIQIVYKSIRENDPQKRPVFMYEPGHRTVDDLVKMLPWQDLSVKGTYTNYSKYKNRRIWVRHSVEEMKRAAEKAGKKQLPLLPVLEMMKAPDPEEIPKVPKWVRHDVYLAMISGAHGFAIFSLFNRKTLNRAYKQYFDAYNRAAVELSGENGLGEIFLFGERRKDLKINIDEGVKEFCLKFRTPGTGGKTAVEYRYPAISHADIAHSSGRYLFMVNSAGETLRCTVSGFPEGKIQIKDAVTGKLLQTVENRELQMRFKPYEVKLLKLERQ